MSSSHAYPPGPPDAPGPARRRVLRNRAGAGPRSSHRRRPGRSAHARAFTGFGAPHAASASGARPSAGATGPSAAGRAHIGRSHGVERRDAPAYRVRGPAGGQVVVDAGRRVGGHAGPAHRRGVRRRDPDGRVAGGRLVADSRPSPRPQPLRPCPARPRSCSRSPRVPSPAPPVIAATSSPTVTVAPPPSIDANLLPVAKHPRVVLRSGVARSASPKAAPAQRRRARPPARGRPRRRRRPIPAPEDSAPSLVPVIPAAPKPTVDPFVRAVQQDIEEDQSQGR